MATTPTPPESLILYGDSLYMGESADLTKRGSPDTPIQSWDHVHTKPENISRIEDILNAMLPPQYVHFFIISQVNDEKCN